MGSEAEKGHESIKYTLSSRLSLWATKVQSYWETPEDTVDYTLEIVHLKGEEAGVFTFHFHESLAELFSESMNSLEFSACPSHIKDHRKAFRE